MLAQFLARALVLVLILGHAQPSSQQELPCAAVTVAVVRDVCEAALRRALAVVLVDVQLDERVGDHPADFVFAQLGGRAAAHLDGRADDRLDD